MTPHSHGDSRTIEALTEAAGIAAAKGEWDRVDQLYGQREPLFSKTALSPDVLARVAQVDRTVADQIKLAQAGLASLLDEAARTRQRIQGLRRWIGATSLDSGTIERHI